MLSRRAIVRALALSSLGLSACGGSSARDLLPEESAVMGKGPAPSAASAPSSTSTTTEPAPSGSASPPPKVACLVPTSAPAGIAPSWSPPAARAKACTDLEINALVKCHVLGESCNDAIGTACEKCAITSSLFDARQGPLIDEVVSMRLNVSGCVALVSNDASPSGCGPRIEAATSCEASSCATCSAFDTIACTNAARPSCEAAAQAQACSQWVDKCLVGANTHDVAFNVVKVFCGQ